MGSFNPLIRLHLRSGFELFQKRCKDPAASRRARSALSLPTMDSFNPRAAVGTLQGRSCGPKSKPVLSPSAALRRALSKGMSGFSAFTHRVRLDCRSEVQWPENRPGDGDCSNHALSRPALGIQTFHTRPRTAPTRAPPAPNPLTRRRTRRNWVDSR
jgi:hypothetical protein